MTRDPTSPTTLVVMLGGMSGGRLEQLMRRALEASALDIADVALAGGRFDRALLLADSPPVLGVPPGVAVEVGDGEPPFHYGARLARAVAEHRIERLVYLGAGSGPLLGESQFEALLDGIGGDGAARCVTNNYFSADLFSLHPASLLGRLDPLPATDNVVPRRLREVFDVEVEELPRTAETQLNLDSPADLAVLALTGRGGPRLAAMVAEAALDTERLGRAAMRFTDREAEVLVAGRVGGSRVWQYLERETACRVRLLAEERGMQAAGRQHGEARSMLAHLIESAGPERVFGDLLPQLCDAAFIDLRPVLVHLGLGASRADRFAADLGLVDKIEEPRLREIVAAANASPVPVVLGGHTLVAGDLLLLNDWAWAEHDRALGIG